MTIARFLDCSKCYERVSHEEAYKRTIESGCPVVLANIIFDQYGCTRIIRVHGAEGHAGVASSGLLAGCAFAKDILKGFLAPLIKGKPSRRDYVDDIVITARGKDPQTTVKNFVDDLETTKGWLKDNNMNLNDTTEQLFISHEQLRKAWKETRPGCQGKETKQAKDLGACNRRLSTSNEVVIEKINSRDPLPKGSTG